MEQNLQDSENQIKEQDEEIQNLQKELAIRDDTVRSLLARLEGFEIENHHLRINATQRQIHE